MFRNAAGLLESKVETIQLLSLDSRKADSISLVSFLVRPAEVQKLFHLRLLTGQEPFSEDLFYCYSFNL